MIIMSIPSLAISKHTTHNVDPLLMGFFMLYYTKLVVFIQSALAALGHLSISERLLHM